jgi:hypothetical protein
MGLTAEHPAVAECLLACTQPLVTSGRQPNQHIPQIARRNIGVQNKLVTLDRDDPPVDPT